MSEYLSARIVYHEPYSDRAVADVLRALAEAVTANWAPSNRDAFSPDAPPQSPDPAAWGEDLERTGLTTVVTMEAPPCVADAPGREALGPEIPVWFSPLSLWHASGRVGKTPHGALLFSLLVTDGVLGEGVAHQATAEMGSTPAEEQDDGWGLRYNRLLELNYSMDVGEANRRLFLGLVRHVAGAHEVFRLEVDPLLLAPAPTDAVAMIRQRGGDPLATDR